MIRVFTVFKVLFGQLLKMVNKKARLDRTRSLKSWKSGINKTELNRDGGVTELSELLWASFWTTRISFFFGSIGQFLQKLVNVLTFWLMSSLRVNVLTFWGLKMRTLTLPHCITVGACKCPAVLPRKFWLLFAKVPGFLTFANIFTWVSKFRPKPPFITTVVYP